MKSTHLIATLFAVLLATAVACSSNGEEQVEPTSPPTSTAVPSPSPTAFPSATAEPTATRTPVPTATPSPAPTATATPAPSPTATPTPGPDPRYGLIVTSDATRALELFGAAHFIDYSTTPNGTDGDTRKVLYLNTVNPIPLEKIQASAAQAPGSVWYILGEPNAHDVRVQDVLVGLHDTYAAIKAADPTALITSPSILNFSFNCINCGGYLQGATWITNFFFDYIDLFGEEPPIDIWAIDVFPIVWPGPDLSVEEAFPTVRDDIVVRQILEFREWIDSRESTKGDPMWITEFGLHWGFEDWEFGVEGCGGRPSPSGKYLTDEVRDYLVRTYSWLEENSGPLNIERWFTFSSYRDITKCVGDSGNGISLLDGAGASANFSEIGTFYNNWVRGIR